MIDCWENFLIQKQEGLQSDDDDYEKRWKESILWYSVSLLMTHNHLEALFSTVLYHPKIMQVRFSCWNQYHRLTIHKTDPKKNIQLYSRTLNLLQASLEWKKSFPKFYDCI